MNNKNSTFNSSKNLSLKYSMDLLNSLDNKTKSYICQKNNKKLLTKLIINFLCA